jgi:glutamine amidotransferase
MRSLNKTGLADELRRFQGPLFGVCVGMQLLFDYSSEDDTPCLGLIEGDVQRIRATPLPHIGWNSIEEASDVVLSDSPSGNPLFYFVHSFAVRPSDRRVIVGRTSYGEDTFPSAVRSGLVTGVQFHPEKSGRAGLAVLASFLRTPGANRHVA